MAIVIGIDPGFRGGLCCLRNGTPQVRPMPIIGTKKRQLDEAGVELILRDWGSGAFVVIEKVGAMPKQGVVSMFNFGCGYGIIRGICRGLNLGYILVRPQRWKKEVLVGLDRKDKASSILYVQRKYPGLDIRRTSRSKPSDGIADAVCLAEYGLMQRGEI